MYTVELVASPRVEAEWIAAGPGAALLARRLDPVQEPFWRHAQRALFVLRDGATRRIAGRIGAVSNARHDATHGDGAGFFAWLDCPDAPTPARALFEAASQWLRERGHTRVRGPLHLGLGEDLGLITLGHELPGGPLVPPSAPHLPALIERIGFAVVQERHAYAWSRDEMPPPPASLRTREERSTARGAVSYRPLDAGLDAPSRDAEALRFLAAYNAAFAGRAGFVPLTEDEARARLREILAFGDPRLVWLAEVDGAPAGIVIALPALPEEPAAPSFASPLAALRSLRGALSRRRMERAHLVAIAVEPRFRGLHVGAQLLLRAWRAALDLGVREAELSGVDPADEVMQQLLWRFGCRRIRAYKVYERGL